MKQQTNTSTRQHKIARRIALSMIATVSLATACDFTTNTGYGCTYFSDGDTAQVSLGGDRGVTEHLRVDGQWEADVAGQTSVTVDAGTNSIIEVRLRGNSYPNGDNGEYATATCTQTASPATPDTTAPETPMKPVLAGVASDSISLELIDNGDDVGVTGFTVFRNTVDDFGSAQPTAVAASGGASTQYVDTGVSAGTTYYYWLKASDAAQNLSSRSGALHVQTPSQTGNCDQTSATGNWRTAELCGVWQIIDEDGAVVHWNAVNVRGHSLVQHPLGNEDVAALKTRFDQVRLNLYWAQTQPNASGVSASNPHIVKALEFLNRAAAHDVDVILDPVHLGGTDFGIPTWAYDQEGLTQASQRGPGTSFVAWAGSDGQATRVQNYLAGLRQVGILDHPAVIAVEVVNEPHPTNSVEAVGAPKQADLMDAYASLIDVIRANGNDNKLAVVGAYYGGTRHGGAQDNNGVSQHNELKNRLTDQNYKNVVWTAHSYFTGAGDDDGQKTDGGRDAGVWAEGSGSGGCYTGGNKNVGAPWSCPDNLSNLAAVQAAHRANALGHWQYAQAADMPFFLGEWGVGRQRVQAGEYRGWEDADQLLCHKIQAYRNVDGQGTEISWAVWSFDAAADGFGLYNSRDGVNNGDTGRSYLQPNSWVDGDTFPNSADQGAWAGKAWGYASAFGPQGC